MSEEAAARWIDQVANDDGEVWKDNVSLGAGEDDDDGNGGELEDNLLVDDEELLGEGVKPDRTVAVDLDSSISPQRLRAGHIVAGFNHTPGQIDGIAMRLLQRSLAKALGTRASGSAPGLISGSGTTLTSPLPPVVAILDDAGHPLGAAGRADAAKFEPLFFPVSTSAAAALEPKAANAETDPEMRNRRVDVGTRWFVLALQEIAAVIGPAEAPTAQSHHLEARRADYIARDAAQKEPLGAAADAREGAVEAERAWNEDPLEWDTLEPHEETDRVLQRACIAMTEIVSTSRYCGFSHAACAAATTLLYPLATSTVMLCRHLPVWYYAAAALCAIWRRTSSAHHLQPKHDKPNPAPPALSALERASSRDIDGPSIDWKPVFRLCVFLNASSEWTASGAAAAPHQPDAARAMATQLLNHACRFMPAQAVELVWRQQLASYGSELDYADRALPMRMMGRFGGAVDPATLEVQLRALREAVRTYSSLCTSTSAGDDVLRLFHDFAREVLTTPGNRWRRVIESLELIVHSGGADAAAAKTLLEQHRALVDEFVELQKETVDRVAELLPGLMRNSGIYSSCLGRLLEHGHPVAMEEAVRLRRVLEPALTPKSGAKEFAQVVADALSHVRELREVALTAHRLWAKGPAGKSSYADTSLAKRLLPVMRLDPATLQKFLSLTRPLLLNAIFSSRLHSTACSGLRHAVSLDPTPRTLAHVLAAVQLGMSEATGETQQANLSHGVLLSVIGPAVVQSAYVAAREPSAPDWAKMPAPGAAAGDVTPDLVKQMVDAHESPRGCIEASARSLLDAVLVHAESALDARAERALSSIAALLHSGLFDGLDREAREGIIKELTERMTMRYGAQSSFPTEKMSMYLSGVCGGALRLALNFPPDHAAAVTLRFVNAFIDPGRATPTSRNAASSIITESVRFACHYAHLHPTARWGGVSPVLYILTPVLQLAETFLSKDMLSENIVATRMRYLAFAMLGLTAAAAAEVRPQVEAWVRRFAEWYTQTVEAAGESLEENVWKPVRVGVSRIGGVVDAYLRALLTPVAFVNGAGSDSLPPAVVDMRNAREKPVPMEYVHAGIEEFAAAREFTQWVLDQVVETLNRAEARPVDANSRFMHLSLGLSLVNGVNLAAALLPSAVDAQTRRLLRARFSASPLVKTAGQSHQDPAEKATADVVGEESWWQARLPMLLHDTAVLPDNFDAAPVARRIVELRLRALRATVAQLPPPGSAANAFGNSSDVSMSLPALRALQDGFDFTRVQASTFSFSSIATGLPAVTFWSSAVKEAHRVALWRYRGGPTLGAPVLFREHVEEADVLLQLSFSPLATVRKVFQDRFVARVRPMLRGGLAEATVDEVVAPLVRAMGTKELGWLAAASDTDVKAFLFTAMKLCRVCLNDARVLDLAVPLLKELVLGPQLKRPSNERLRDFVVRALGDSFTILAAAPSLPSHTAWWLEMAQRPHQPPLNVARCIGMARRFIRVALRACVTDPRALLVRSDAVDGVSPQAINFLVDIASNLHRATEPAVLLLIRLAAVYIVGRHPIVHIPITPLGTHSPWACSTAAAEAAQAANWQPLKDAEASPGFYWVQMLANVKLTEMYRAPTLCQMAPGALSDVAAALGRAALRPEVIRGSLHVHTSLLRAAALAASRGGGQEAITQPPWAALCGGALAVAELEPDLVALPPVVRNLRAAKRVSQVWLEAINAFHNDCFTRAASTADGAKADDAPAEGDASAGSSVVAEFQASSVAMQRLLLLAYHTIPHGTTDPAAIAARAELRTQHANAIFQVVLLDKRVPREATAMWTTSLMQTLLMSCDDAERFELACTVTPAVVACAGPASPSTASPQELQMPAAGDAAIPFIDAGQREAVVRVDATRLLSAIVDSRIVVSGPLMVALVQKFPSLLRTTYNDPSPIVRQTVAHVIGSALASSVRMAPSLLAIRNDATLTGSVSLPWSDYLTINEVAAKQLLDIVTGSLMPLVRRNPSTEEKRGMARTAATVAPTGSAVTPPLLGPHAAAPSAAGNPTPPDAQLLSAPTKDLAPGGDASPESAVTEPIPPTPSPAEVPAGVEDEAEVVPISGRAAASYLIIATGNGQAPAYALSRYLIPYLPLIASRLLAVPSLAEIAPNTVRVLAKNVHAQVVWYRETFEAMLRATVLTMLPFAGDCAQAEAIRAAARAPVAAKSNVQRVSVGDAKAPSGPSLGAHLMEPPQDTDDGVAALVMSPMRSPLDPTMAAKMPSTAAMAGGSSALVAAQLGPLLQLLRTLASAMFAPPSGIDPLATAAVMVDAPRARALAPLCQSAISAWASMLNRAHVRQFAVTMLQKADPAAAPTGPSAPLPKALQPTAGGPSLFAAANSLVAVVNAFPDGVPAFVPPLLMRLIKLSALAASAGKQQQQQQEEEAEPHSPVAEAAQSGAARALEVGRVSRDGLMRWWTAHLDQWEHVHRLAFTEAQATALAEAVRSRSYFV